ncbi:MAG: FHA domain-containing protein [Actinomyces ruminicola]|uniref:Uncharacterized membrane protein YckC, RDD family n=1 Tax=Actinomyces ruminicola TaxID=332524 RepID=A0A1G9ZPM2_9ACTO|nr:RDD family protein [Actinomyces ruminicola]MBE6481623.1 FHA domain-containing protein [Actinomyces ruminicola]SDN23492.1 Uncharacterized membrane protein YckC, RDD family [Actinomyces ruminicola]
MTATSASRRTNGGPAAPPHASAEKVSAEAPPSSAGTFPPAPVVAGPAPVRARVLAGLIDLAGGAVLSGMLASLLRLVGGASWMMSLLVAAVIVLAVREVVLGRTGWTPGGRLMGVQLVSDRTGLPPGTGLILHADLTFICVLPTLGLGAIALMHTVAADPQGRGWHDRLTGVRMVHAPARPPAAAPASAPPAPHAAQAGRRSPFSDGRFSFTPSNSPITEVADTLDSTRAAASIPNTKSAIIDSVPWSAVPTPLDSTTDDVPKVPTGEAETSAVALNAHAAGPASPAPNADASAAVPETRRRRRAAQRKREADSVRIRLVPADGGSPILLTAPTVVGRDPANISEYPGAKHVSLPDVSRSISKTHAALAPVPGGLWVTDLHSTNGTRIEQQGTVKQAQPEVPAPAPVGSVLILGRAEYRIED